MADAGFEKVIFDRPFHEIISNGDGGDFVVVLDSFVVVTVESCDVGDFEVELIC